MRKFFLLLCWIGTLSAEPLLEFKPGYFHFSDSHLRKIYGDGALDLGISVTYPIWKRINCYFSIESIHKKSKDRQRPFRVELSMVPISLGAQVSQPLSSAVDWYATIGPQFIFYHQHNHRPTILNRQDKNGFGGFVNTGFVFHVFPHWTLNTFGQYSYRIVHYQDLEVDPLFLQTFHGRTIQIGGLLIGAGIGYLF